METANKHITRSKVAQCIWMVELTINTLMAQTILKAPPLYISRVKPTRRGTKYKYHILIQRVSQIPSSKWHLG